ncbi:MAG TPA: phosphoenolpyruvate synthase [Burkholderiales bacterium]|nr:phosphoenolpyruvate synthase [Burkholderiales bacterium]
MDSYIVPLHALRMTDVSRVGGKNASLGEMISELHAAGVRVPEGFATTAQAFRDFLDANGLVERIAGELRSLDVDNVSALAASGQKIRKWMCDAELPARLIEEVRQAYQKMGTDIAVAVRSSATAEDLPQASFAGQQETFLNVSGVETVLAALKRVFASLYNDRAIAYRVHQGFDHDAVALSSGIQRMVRSDLAASGVMFTVDTESGFDQVVFITASYGLGETIVQGAVNPDEFYVYKPALLEKCPAIVRRRLGEKASKMVFSADAGHSVKTIEVPGADRGRFSISDSEAEELARLAITIEEHYGRAMDIEWGKDGEDGKLYVLQARPETVAARAVVQQRFRLLEQSRVLVTGRAIGQKIGSGRVRLVARPAEMHRVEPGDVLVTDMTDPDWEPVMKRASAIVTNRGGRTCHAAIIARELGIPAVVGCGDATETLRNALQVTVSCAEGDTGVIYEGLLKIETSEINLQSMPDIPVKICLNVGNPELAFDFQRLPNSGVGLARLEFIITNMIGIHPKAALAYPRLADDVKKAVAEKSAGYSSPVDFYVEKLVEGIATLACGFFPKPVIVRLSDFKSNEYSGLIGGKDFEATEENPMLGFRGAARFVSEDFRDCFALECRALKRVRDEMGLTNIEIMVPFVRTVAEAAAVIKALEHNQLKRGKNGLRVIMMCELPTNALNAEEFLRHFDGFSIGSNDMTQLTLGVDRDSGVVADAFDERDPSVKALLRLAIQTCRKEGKYVGICGQGPSDHPDYAEWLVEEGIEAISLNPDTVIDTWLRLANARVRSKEQRSEAIRERHKGL